MPYDEKLYERIGRMIEGWTQIEHKKMFGGICSLIRGNMFCGVYKEFLILRLGEDEAARAMKDDRRSYILPFDITGKPMKGWVMVKPEGLAGNAVLKKWIERARDFALTLPAK
jgi:hypothetical protein